MKKFKLSECGDRGWFIGNFDKAAFRTTEFEVCYQSNTRTQTPTHIHKETYEITLTLSGRSVVNGHIIEPGEIFILEPGEVSQIEYLEDTSVITIKCPSNPTDKHYL